MIICDGCNVQGSWEHRCHGSRAVVSGEQTNRPCECLPCVETELLFPADPAAKLRVGDKVEIEFAESGERRSAVIIEFGESFCPRLDIKNWSIEMAEKYYIKKKIANGQ